MDDGEALIRAIRANRDDDTPRLVYADWLEDRGDLARAEFVRLQCRLSAHPDHHPDWEANWTREQELLRDHGRGWGAALAGFSPGSAEFDRGFVSSIFANDVTEFTRVLPELVRVTDTDRLDICEAADENVGVLSRCEAMAEIRDLSTNRLIRGLSVDGIARLVRSPQLRNLRRLDLSGAYLGPGNPDAALLAREPVLPRLEHLHFGLSFRPDVRRVVELLRSPHRRRLVGLTVRYLDESDVEALCDVPELARLTHLDIGWTTPSDAAARRLAGCPYLDRIELLNYSGDGMADNPAQGALRERFGDRVVLDPDVHYGGPVGSAYHRQVRTGRRR